MVVGDDAGFEERHESKPSHPTVECRQTGLVEGEQVMAVTNCPLTLSCRIGINAQFGWEGENFRMIYGAKYGLSVPEGPWWKQILGSSIDQGGYQDVKVDVQDWFPGFSYKGQRYACACLAYSAKAKISVDGGVFLGRIGAAVAAYYLWPVLVRAAPVLIPRPLPVPLLRM